MEAFEVELTKRGEVFDPAQVDAVLAAVPRFSDLFVLVHGWNNDAAQARKLYDDLFQSVDDLLQEDVVDGIAGRTFGQVRVLWPSKRFADEDLIPGGGAASATNENHEALVSLLEELKNDPERLGEATTDPVRSAAIERAQALVPSLETDEGARRQFVLELRSMLDPSAAHLDDGSEEFFTRDPLELFEELKEPVSAPAGPGGGGGATSVSGAGGAAGLKDLLSGIQAAARRIANYTTYYEMKARAGLVGRTGLQSVLRQIRETKGDVRIHLVGHSFGGRLVTAAADALDPNTPRVSMTLLQAAYSHNGLAQRFDDKHDGFFRKLVSEKRASGPILITHTKNDKAVGVAYPLASRLAHQKAAALGDENDPYGGMGRNGAQRTPEAVRGELLRVRKPYELRPGKVYNLRADPFIDGHSDVTGHEVAYALMSAVAAT